MTMNKDPWSTRKNLYLTPVPKEVTKPKTRWRVWPILWTAIKRTCMLIGAAVLISAILSAWIASSLIKDAQPQTLPSEFVLFMNFDGQLGDLAQDVSLADPFASSGPTMKDYLDALDRAKADPRVQGIYARMEVGGYSLAHIQELRKAIKAFRDSGKFAYIYSSSYGEAGGLGSYYLATAFDEIWLQPMGIVAITGVSAEMPFLRSVFEQVGIEPQFFQREEFKSAYESLTNSEMSDANRKMTEYLVKDLTDTISADIASDLGILSESFKALVDLGLFTSQEAKSAGLVTNVDYADVLVKQINAQINGDAQEDANYVPIRNYIRIHKQKQEQTLSHALMASQEKGKGKAKPSKPSVALIYAVGMILPSDGEDGGGPAGLMGDGIAGADKIAAALLEAADDDSISAVVLRVNSPGGSPVASETILRATQIVKEKGKPVIVSMGPTAASGGYWISAYADHIFVLPTTVTGSIGVVGGKFSVQELWAKLGISWERIQWGKNAGLWSVNTPFSESEAERMNAMLDNIYDNFLERVATGRQMDLEEVRKIAKGRVWTGKSALRIGLADKEGGLNEALDYAAKLSGVKDRHGANVVIIPRPKNAIERLIQLLEQQVYAGQMLQTQARVMENFEPLAKQVEIVRNPQSYTVYTPIELK